MYTYIFIYIFVSNPFKLLEDSMALHWAEAILATIHRK